MTDQILETAAANADEIVRLEMRAERLEHALNALVAAVNFETPGIRGDSEVERRCQILEECAAEADVVLREGRSAALADSPRASLRTALWATDAVWARYYRDGATLGKLTEEFGGTVYDYSPWLTQPLMRAAQEASS